VSRLDDWRYGMQGFLVNRDIINLAPPFLTVLQVHRECFGWGVAKWFLAIAVDKIDCWSSNGTLIIWHLDRKSWQRSWEDHAVLTFHSLKHWLACDWILVMGTCLKIFVILPGTNQVITRNIQIFSCMDPD
jgi:hypothetical protein